MILSKLTFAIDKMAGQVRQLTILVFAADLVSPKDAKEAAKKLLESGVR